MDEILTIQVRSFKVGFEIFKSQIQFKNSSRDNSLLTYTNTLSFTTIWRFILYEFLFCATNHITLGHIYGRSDLVSWEVCCENFVANHILYLLLIPEGDLFYHIHAQVSIKQFTIIVAKYVVRWLKKSMIKNMAKEQP